MANMTGTSRLAAVLCGLLCALCAGPVRLLAQTAPEQTAPTYPQTESGFSAQIASAVEAYQKGDTVAGRHLLEQLHLPQSADWFAEQIGTEQSKALADRYDRLFDNFVDSMEKTIEDIVRTKGSKLVTNLKDGTREPPRARLPNQKLSGIIPVKEPLIFNCPFAITVNGSEVVSWMDSFTYQDGIFRFIGYGAWPFWDWEDGSDGKAPESGHFVQTPILITRVPPVYPVGFEDRGIEGDVVLHVSIETDGSVRDITVVQGDPTFAKAAIDAVKKWHYKPATFGGKPIKSDLNVTVSFKHP